MFSLVDFLTLEDGTNRAFQNISKELPPYAVQYLRGGQISHDNLATQSLV